MKRIFCSFLFCITSLVGEELAQDQAELCIGNSLYLVQQAVELAKQHDYPFVKILSYDLYLRGDRLHYSSADPFPEGERFSFAFENGTMEVLCFSSNTTQCLCLEVAKVSPWLTPNP